MRDRRCFQAILGATVVMALSSACSASRPASTAEDGTWVGAITTEGNVTTVVNESGSVWGGTARLLEEASIGVDAGEDPYMFGRVTSVWSTAEAIYVVDDGVPTVRVYDREGKHLRDIGRRGQGPGEYERPYRVAIRDDGTILLSERGAMMKVIVYSPIGVFVDTWSWSGRVFLVTPRMLMTRDGTPYLEAVELEGDVPTEEQHIYGMQGGGPGGKLGELRKFPRLDLALQPSLTYMDGRMVTSLPFAPLPQRAMLTSGALVYGISAQYRFTIEEVGGAKVVVERRAEPVALLPAERQAHERFTTSDIRSRDPGWTWNGPRIPDNKPAYEGLYPAQDGRLLVSRKGQGEPFDGPDCIDDPAPNDFVEARRENRTLQVCWSDPLIWDVFGSDGLYLGALDLPGLRIVADPFLDGDTLLLAVEDEAGTIVVKRYLLVLPGEQGL